MVLFWSRLLLPSILGEIRGDTVLLQSLNPSCYDSEDLMIRCLGWIRGGQWSSGIETAPRSWRLDGSFALVRCICCGLVFAAGLGAQSIGYGQPREPVAAESVIEQTKALSSGVVPITERAGDQHAECVHSGNTHEEKGSTIDILFSNKLFALFAVVALGLLVGRVEVAKLSLGSSGVIFSALLMGHLGYGVPAGVGSLGLVLFIYSVGIGAGPSFFSSFARSGVQLAKLTLLVVLIAVVTVAIASSIGGIPIELAAGIFAGSLTSTPALAAALDSVAGTKSLISVGYGVAYPAGVIGIVLFVQLLPRLLRLNLVEEGKRQGRAEERYRVVRLGVRVTNPALFGKAIISPRAEILSSFGFKVTRQMVQGLLVPITHESTFEEGQVLLIVGDARNADAVVDYFGESFDSKGWHDDELVSTRETFVVTASQVVGKTLAELDLFNMLGVLITRIRRTGGEFVPVGTSTLEYADQVTVVGSAESLASFSQFVGHREKALQETDLYSLAGGVLLGIFVGLIPLSLPGTKPIHLGLAGGTLVVALLLGHFGRIGRIVGRVPLAAQQVLREVGLLLFLAEAGVDAGGLFVAIVQQYGVVLFLVAILTTVMPLVIGYAIARSVIRIPVLETLGGLCGAMTSTPALGVMANTVDSTVPMVSYATAYPVALVFKIAAIQLLVFLVSWLG